MDLNPGKRHRGLLLSTKIVIRLALPRIARDMMRSNVLLREFERAGLTQSFNLASYWLRRKYNGRICRICILLLGSLADDHYSATNFS